MAISEKDKLGLIKAMSEEYVKYGAYSDDAKNASALDELVNCIWCVLTYGDDTPEEE